MTYAELALTVPGDVPLGRLSRAHPESLFRVLAAVATDAGGVARVEVVGPAARSLPDADAGVADLAVFRADGESALVQIETGEPGLLAPIRDCGVPIETPFEVRDGELDLAVTVTRERLSELGEALADYGIDYAVERIERGADPPSEPLLTERQRQVVTEAIERGYYDTPRRISLSELAADLGVAKSTCSEVLHRAEERAMKDLFEEREDGERTAVPAAPSAD